MTPESSTATGTSDVFAEYAKASPDDILVRLTIANRGPERATLHLLPTLWFRNDRADWITKENRAASKPDIRNRTFSRRSS